MGKVRIIPQTINPLTQIKIGTTAKKKVAAYARVSTDQEEQESSFDSFAHAKYNENSIHEINIFPDEIEIAIRC